jgi:hypothetical protein
MPCKDSRKTKRKSAFYLHVHLSFLDTKKTVAVFVISRAIFIFAVGSPLKLQFMGNSSNHTSVRVSIPELWSSLAFQKCLYSSAIKSGGKFRDLKKLLGRIRETELEIAIVYLKEKFSEQLT